MGKLCDSETKEKLGKLCVVINGYCKQSGVSHQESTTVRELSAKTGFSEGWIFNVVESHLISECFNQVDCEWELGDEAFKNHIMIPARFGHHTPAACGLRSEP